MWPRVDLKAFRQKRREEKKIILSFVITYQEKSIRFAVYEVYDSVGKPFVPLILAIWSTAHGGRGSRNPFRFLFCFCTPFIVV
jgi:hypothetical protein